MILAGFSRVTCLLALLCLPFLLQTKAAISLGIVPADAQSTTAADLLTAELSKIGGIALLERSDLQKIIAEQALSLALPDDVLNAGKLAGAEALLLLQHSTRNTGNGRAAEQQLHLRLVSVRHGILLHLSESAWPVDDPHAWSERTGREIAQELARVHSSPDKALKVSLLSFKSPTDSREARLLDQEINALLLKRLALETNLVVLERQKLGATFFERALTAETNPFWTGSLLVEGAVNKLGFSPNQVSIEARLALPGATPVVVNLQENRAQLPRLVDTLVRQIVETLSGKSSVQWDPAGEADRYFQDAEWALRWGLWAQAQSAADAAWALGKKSQETAILRVQAYGRAANSDTGMRWSAPQRRTRGFGKPAPPQTLRNAISALSIYLAHSLKMPAAHSNTNQAWQSTGLEALQQASHVLYHYFYMADARGGHEDELAELRALCRDVADWLGNRSAVRAAFYLDGETPLTPDTIRVTLGRGHFYRVKAMFGALWQERPQDALAMHRELIHAPSFPAIRDVYYQDALWQCVPVGGWTWSQRSNNIPRWRGFLKELQQSTNPVVQVEAKILEIASLVRDQEIHQGIRDLLDLIESHSETLAGHRAPLNYGSLSSDLRYLYPSGVSTPERTALQQELTARNKMLKDLDSRQRQYANAAARFAAQKQFLLSANFEFSAYARTFSSADNYQPDQAKELLELLQTYRVTLTNALADPAVPRKGGIQGMFRMVARLESSLARTLSEPPPANPAPRTAPTQAPSRPVPVPVASTPIVTNILTISRYLELPSDAFTFSNPSSRQLRCLFIQDGILWARFDSEGHIPGDNYRRRREGRIASINLADGKTQIIELPSTRFQSRRQLPHPDFQLLNGSLYAAGAPQLQKYDFQQKQWVGLPLPLHPDASLHVLNQKLYALTPESLLEVAPDGASARTLVSARRQPPATRLDTLTDLSRIYLLPAPGAFRVWANHDLYDFDGSDFHLVRQIARARAFSAGESLLILEQNHHGPDLAYQVSPQGEPIPIFAHLPGNRRGWQPRARNSRESIPEVAWKGIEQLSLNIAACLFLDQSLLCFGAPVPTAGRTPPSPWSHLFHLRHGMETPVMLSLASGPGVPPLHDSSKGYQFSDPVMMLADQTHLVFARRHTAGFWVVSRDALEHAGQAAKPAPPATEGKP